ncbi:MAG: hypothetical protein K0Q87_4520 [Neobacillus sp.]|jgi:hypothetical protein|nr:hypothetical protein [Neobacillus sp.]
MNYSEWKVTSNRIDGEKIYAAYRLRDTNEVDHSGNREYAGGWTNNRDAAQVIADQLNSRAEGIRP